MEYIIINAALNSHRNLKSNRISKKLEMLSSGFAVQNRMGHALANVGITHENLTVAGMPAKGRRGVSHGDVIGLKREDYKGFDIPKTYCEYDIRLKATGLLRGKSASIAHMWHAPQARAIAYGTP